MEPLSIIALTGNILQFVERVAFLISSSRDVSVSGASEENIELSTIAEELQELVSRVTPTENGKHAKLNQEEASIRALGEQCNEVAQQLLDVLETLKVKNKNSSFARVESFYKVLLAEWKKPKIDALQKRLDRIGNNIQAHVASYDSQKIISQLDGLSAQNRFLHAHRNGEISNLRESIIGIFKDIGTKMKIEEDRNSTSEALLSAAASGSQYAAEQLVLEQLRFEEINYRCDAIRSAHDDTLSWLFSTSEQQSPVTFDEWLGSDDDLFWISGKPGSGKSTLMKFLSCNPQIVEKLKIWTKQKRLIHAAYFFWDAGKSIQKSQEGLLRSLLFDILRQNPNLIAQVYPNIWRLLSPSNHGPVATSSNNTAVRVSLSIQGLLETLRAASTAAAGSDTKFCFLIDGLDEYEGQAHDMIELISLLRKLDNVKLCVSSRPWNEFEREFGKDVSRTLFMQDYNGPDIKRYVHDTLNKDDNYQDLEDKEINGKLLVEDVVQKANGVFFWVFLVVRSLKNGLGNGDSVSDLRKRLSELPNELNTYFDRIILSDVEEFYHGQSAEMFTVTLEGEEDIPLMAYWYLREDEKAIMTMETKPLSIQQVNKRSKDTTKRLNASCKGLLEVRHLTPLDGEEESSALPSSILFNRKVGFLHRTVREYLMLDETRSILRRWCSTGFDPHETICKILVAQTKISPDDAQYSRHMSSINNLLCHHRSLICPRPGRAIITELDNRSTLAFHAQSSNDAAKDESLEEAKQISSGCENGMRDEKGHVSRLLGGMRRKFRKGLR